MARQAGPPTQPQAQNEIVVAYLSIPIISRVLLTATVGLSLITHLKLLEYHRVMLIWEDVFKKFHFWKLITCFFIHKVDFSFIFILMFMFRFTRYLEKETFLGKPEDYLYYFILTGITALVGANILNLYVLGDTLVSLITTLWSLHNPEQMVSFYFGITFKAKYLPWIQAGVSFVFSTQIPSADLLGICVSNIYFYLKNTYAARGGLDYLEAPSFLKRLFPEGSRVSSRPEGYQAVTPQGTGPSSSGGYSWGRGSRLGD